MAQGWAGVRSASAVGPYPLLGGEGAGCGRSMEHRGARLPYMQRCAGPPLQLLWAGLPWRETGQAAKQGKEQGAKGSLIVRLKSGAGRRRR
jgi:hypothetical protein